MANYIGAARSNYFRVKDQAAFRKAMGELEVDIIEDRDGRVGLLSREADGAGWPSFTYDEQAEEYREFDIADLVAEHLADGEVAVLLEAGAEKLRYLVGHAVAINSAGQTVTVNLQDIYEKAEQLGANITRAEY